MAQIYLTSPDFVKSVTNISSNIQDKYIQSAIRESCDIDVQEVIGTELYEKLKKLVKENKIAEPNNVVYKKLLDVLQYFISYSVVSRLVVISSIKIDNIGANITGDEKVQNVDFDEIFHLEQYYRNKADFYKKRVQDYLLENQTVLKELFKNNCFDIHANTYSAATNGLFLGGARGKRK